MKPNLVDWKNRTLMGLCILFGLLAIGLAPESMTGCSSQPNVAPIVDPVVQVCVAEMTSWQVVIDLSKQAGLDPGVFARVLCSIPSVIAPYLAKQPGASAQAQAAVLRIRSLPDAGL